MESSELFTMALGLAGTPWRVKEANFGGDPESLELVLHFKRGSKFACPECGELCAVHDAVGKRWRHLNFFQWPCKLVARVPRARCEQHGVRLVAVPWARPGSGFTLMMEALMVLLSKQMPTDPAAHLLGVTDTRMWRVLNHHTEAAQARSPNPAKRVWSLRTTGWDEAERYYCSLSNSIRRRCC